MLVCGQIHWRLPHIAVALQLAMSGRQEAAPTIVLQIVLLACDAPAMATSSEPLDPKPRTFQYETMSVGETCPSVADR